MGQYAFYSVNCVPLITCCLDRADIIGDIFLDFLIERRLPWKSTVETTGIPSDIPIERTSFHLARPAAVVPRCLFSRFSAVFAPAAGPAAATAAAAAVPTTVIVAVVDQQAGLGQILGVEKRCFHLLDVLEVREATVAEAGL